MPIYTLSTNCLYVLAYQRALDMARELGKEEKSDLTKNAGACQKALPRRFLYPGV